jgi:putative Holliday junction resolvase
MPKSKQKDKKKNTKSEVVLALDYGSRNIGLAFGTNGFVQPIRIISGANDQVAIHEIGRFVIENNIDKIVVGLPLTKERKETRQSLEIRKFVKFMNIIIKKPVEFYNEYGTTKEAMRDALELGIPQRSRRYTDHLSAGVILKRYFEEKH